MKQQQGVVLVMLLFIILLFTALGVALLTISQRDLLISRHLAEASSAQYAADAGVEWAVAHLPRQHGLLNVFMLDYAQGGSPAFSVSVRPALGRMYDRVIRVKGLAGNKEYLAEVITRYRPLGGYALVGERVRLDKVVVHGHVMADELVFIYDLSRVYGNICDDLRTFMLGGRLERGGVDYQRLETEVDWIDFDQLGVLAVNNGWRVVAGVAGGFFFDEPQVDKRIYVTGDVVLGKGFAFDGVLVVRGQVTIEQLPVGQVVLLAEGEIVFAADLLPGAGSLAAYSSSKITYEGGAAVRGVLVGRELMLSRLEITYCDTAILAVIEDLPAELLSFSPGFTLEWIDLRPRR